MIDLRTIAYYFLVLQPPAERWGDYKQWKVCPKFSYASGFEPQIDPCCGAGDDSGLNDVKLHCTDPNGTPVLVELSFTNLVLL